MLFELITHDFSILPITKKRNELLKKEIKNWDFFLKKERIKGISPIRKTYFNNIILKAKEAIKNKDFNFFVKNQKNELLLIDQKNELFDINIIYLDIEAMNKYDLLIVGLYDGTKYQAFIKGINLFKEPIINYLEKADLIISFNGLSFDQRIIKHYFGSFTEKKHIDLYRLLQKEGLGMPLKKIEEELNITREPRIRNFNFLKAYEQFQEFLITKNYDLIEEFITYNQADVTNLELIISKLQEKKYSLLKKELNNCKVSEIKQ